MDLCEGRLQLLWMRDDFSFEQEPLCSHCGAPMVKSTKMLPLLVNTDKNYLKKQQPAGE
ncbi:cold-inducible protein YdjO-related protein [Paenibacillus darwinianus]|uniref:cold-inducible protein YdjO-related protein n=1 Tax=Paenibacillus darwinianus TaxID=1380763 RepID=UPI0037CB5F48